MKALLLYPDRNYDPEQPLCPDAETLEKDLGINFILKQMAGEDTLIGFVTQRLLFTPLTDPEILRYRQEALQDVLAYPEEIRAMYHICVDAEEIRRKSWSWLTSSYLTGTFSAAMNYLWIYLDHIEDLRYIADKNIDHFHSMAFTAFFRELQEEINDDYLKKTKEALVSLKNAGSLQIHAKLGSFLQGIDYFLCVPEKQRFSLKKAFAPAYKIRGDDTTAQEDLSHRHNRAINELTNALAQAAEHLLAYFNMLRAELSFYVGCLNLRDALASRGLSVCIPEILPENFHDRKAVCLYDGGVALTKGSADGNDFDFSETNLYLITGANQGGKSTFLRSVGQCQLMAQSGMFVCAENAAVPLRSGVFTHFKKEEDDQLESGKLDEELARMSRIVDQIQPNSMLLFNESFAATNEREGSEICRQITSALLENGMEIFSVSHLMTYVESYLNSPRVRFLQAERLDDGTRTHRILTGLPTRTAYGPDIYRDVFGKDI